MDFTVLNYSQNNNNLVLLVKMNRKFYNWYFIVFCWVAEFYLKFG